MDAIYTDTFNVKFIDFANETRKLMSKQTIGNKKHIIYTLLLSVVSNYIENINMANQDGITIIIKTFICKQLNDFIFRLCTDTNENISSTLFNTNNEIIKKTDLQFKQYYYNPKHSDILHDYYKYSFVHHTITSNLLRSLFDVITCCFMLLNTRLFTISEYGQMCFFINSVFNHYINSIERTEINLTTAETIVNTNDILISNFVYNQNIIYNCSEENTFVSEIIKNYKNVNDINKKYHRDMLITPEYYNNEKLYYTQLSFLRLFVKLTSYDIYLLELIRYNLAYFSLYSIQLRDIHCKLNNLNTNILNATEFKDIKLVDEPDYNYPLFTIKHMMFSHNNTSPYLLKVCKEIQIPSKKWIYFKGNSGTGKTTVIQILLKIIANDYAKFFQYSKYDMNAIRKYILFVKSSGDIFQNETVEYNIKFGMDSPPISTIKYYFELFELGNYDNIKDKCADKLSTGEKQRIRVIHTILQVITNKQKRILILDEITSNIDETTETIIMNELRRLQIEYNLSVIHISHSGGHVRYCDYLMRIIEQNILLTENCIV